MKFEMSLVTTLTVMGSLKSRVAAWAAAWGDEEMRMAKALRMTRERSLSTEYILGQEETH